MTDGHHIGRHLGRPSDHSATLGFHAAPVAATGAQLGESPLWVEGVGLLWLDIPARRLLTLDLRGEVSAVGLTALVTCIELGAGTRLAAVTAAGFGWADPVTGEVGQQVAVLDDPDMRMNDGAVDPKGRLWAGSATSDGRLRGALYCRDRQAVTIKADRIGMSNGIDWSTDGRTVYHVDSTMGVVRAHDFNLTDGTLGHSRELRAVPPVIGMPDGLTVDADGNLWLAVWGAGQVWRLDPSTGATTAVVHVPTSLTTSCCFGGSDLHTLFITTADDQEVGGGLLYEVDVPATGRLPHRVSSMSL